MVTTTRDSWTGTRGITSLDLPEDWDEAASVLRERAHFQSPTTQEYSPVVAERAVKWLFQEFGNDPGLYDFSIREAIEWYLNM